MSIATVQQTDNGSSLQRSEMEAGSVEEGHTHSSIKIEQAK